MCDERCHYHSQLLRKGIGEAEGQDTADDLLRECVRLSFLPDEEFMGEEAEAKKEMDEA